MSSTIAIARKCDDWRSPKSTTAPIIALTFDPLPSIYRRCLRTRFPNSHSRRANDSPHSSDTFFYELLTGYFFVWGMAARTSGVDVVFLRPRRRLVFGEDVLWLNGNGSQRAVQVLPDPFGSKTLTNYVKPKTFAAPAPGTISSPGPRKHPGSDELAI